MKFEKNIQIFGKKVNKNYRLLPKRLYGRKILKNHDNRKGEVEKGVRTSPTTLQFESMVRIDDYYL